MKGWTEYSIPEVPGAKRDSVGRRVPGASFLLSYSASWPMVPEVSGIAKVQILQPFPSLPAPKVTEQKQSQRREIIISGLKSPLYHSPFAPPWLSRN